MTSLPERRPIVRGRHVAHGQRSDGHAIRLVPGGREGILHQGISWAHD